MQIYHNPRCRKSRETLELIKEAGIEPEIILYLEDTPSEDELKVVLGKLGISAEKLLRKNESIFKDNFKGKEYSDEEWIKIMVEHPKLIERPIVIKGEKAVLGRPPGNVREIL